MLATTLDTRDPTAEATVRALAWKLLYGNHRPSLGPDRWEALVDEVDGPADVKALGVDEEAPLGPFVAALDRVEDALGEPDPQTLGTAFVERWATMYQRLVEHLEGRPDRMLEVAVQEVYPWFFDAGNARVVERGASSVTVAVESPLPEGFLAGLWKGFATVVGAQATVESTGDGRFRVSWDAAPETRPSRARVLFQATRARMLPATVGPVLVGGALAAWQASFDAVGFGLALAGAVCLHLAFNLLNDVLDHRRGVDEANLTPTPFSGGSRVLQRGLMGSDAMLGLAAALGVAGVGLGGFLVARTGLGVLALSAAGVLVGYAYSGAPFRLADRGAGELAAGLVFGPLIVAGTHAVQAGAVSLEALAAGAPLGASMAAVLMVNELPDAPWDARTGRRTLVVRLGDLAPLGAGLALLIPYPVLAWVVLAGTLPVAALVALAGLPFALGLGHRVRTAGTDADAIARLQGPVMLLHATTGLLMATGILWEVFAT